MKDEAPYGPMRCRHCGDVIGAYEPMVLVTPTGPRDTSLAAERQLTGTMHPCYHEACFMRAADDSRPGG